MKTNLELRIPPEAQVTTVVRRNFDGVETKADLLANECHLMVVNGILRHYI